MSSFIQTTDYSHAITDEIRLTVISDDDLATIEEGVIAEAKSYLRKKYNVASIFSQSGASRNQQLLNHLVSMCIYRAIAKGNYRAMPQVRSDLYQDALSFLKKSALPNDHPQAIYPDLPPLSQTTAQSTFVGGGNGKYNSGF